MTGLIHSVMITPGLYWPAGQPSTLLSAHTHTVLEEGERHAEEREREEKKRECKISQTDRRDDREERRRERGEREERGEKLREKAMQKS